jgi:hypothetical protein
MTSFSPETWVLLGVVAGLAVIAILYIFAAQAREQVMTHDLKRRVHELHEQYTNRLAVMRARAKALEEMETMARRGWDDGASGEYDVVEEANAA